MTQNRKMFTNIKNLIELIVALLGCNNNLTVKAKEIFLVIR